MNIFNLSFGKDSMATLLLAIEQGIPIDRVMYCEIKFNDEISGEHPLMAAWIPEAERILKERFGITVEHAFSRTYLDWFYKPYVRGQHKGKIHGFPKVRGAWCNRELKINAIRKYRKQFKGVKEVQFVGIAIDEQYRFDRMKKQETKNRKFRSLLIEQNLTEQDAFSICEKYGLLAPVYHELGGFRGGCWFCPKQCYADLYALWKNYPEHFAFLKTLEKDSVHSFKPTLNISDFAKRFENGYVPIRRKKRDKYVQTSIFDFLRAQICAEIVKETEK